MSSSIRFTRNDENAAPAQPIKPGTNQVSKRPLADITNAQPSAANPFTHHPKIRRTATLKPVSNPRRQSGRLTKRAHHILNINNNTISRKLHFLPDHIATAALIQAPRLPPTVANIDADDSDNHLAVSQLAAEIYANFFKREAKFMSNPDYMLNQTDITVKMRAILIDWLVDVHLKFKLQTETLHLTVSIIDRYLEKTLVKRRRLQLVGVTAMLIASKYQEIYAPEVADFVYIADKAYNKEEILSMEANILAILKFDVTLPSTLVFMHRVLKACHRIATPEHDMHRSLTHYLVELSLQDANMLQFRPSVRAAAACRVAAKLCSTNLMWDQTMIFHCGGWTAQQLAGCEGEMLRMLTHEQQDVNGTNKLTAVKRKFSAVKYSCIGTTIMDLDRMQPNVQEMEMSD